MNRCGFASFGGCVPVARSWSMSIPAVWVAYAKARRAEAVIGSSRTPRSCSQTSGKVLRSAHAQSAANGRGSRQSLNPSASAGKEGLPPSSEYVPRLQQVRARSAQRPGTCETQTRCLPAEQRRRAARGSLNAEKREAVRLMRYEYMQEKYSTAGERFDQGLNKNAALGWQVLSIDRVKKVFLVTYQRPLPQQLIFTNFASSAFPNEFREMRKSGYRLVAVNRAEDQTVSTSSRGAESGPMLQAVWELHTTDNLRAKTAASDPIAA